MLPTDFPGEKLVIKLWETLTEKGIGSLLMPWQTRRTDGTRIELRRREMLMLAQTEIDILEMRAGRKYLSDDGSLLTWPTPNSQSEELAHSAQKSQLRIGSLVERIIGNDAANTMRQEINASKAVLHAEEVLANDTQSPPDRAIDEDWVFRWRDYAGRVSNNELQELWGKILAGEVKSPGAYSLRTLEFLRELSKAEAERITQLAKFAIERCVVRSASQYLEEHGISFDLLLEMQDLGVVSGVEALGLRRQWMSTSSDRFIRALRSNGKVLVIEHEDADKTVTLDAYLLTNVGNELLGLGSFSPDVDYLRLVGETIAKQGFKVGLADWEQKTETEGRYFNRQNISDSEESATGESVDLTDSS